MSAEFECRNCDKSITHRAGLEWRHDDPNTRYCDPANWRTSTLAAPEEAL